ncbi:bifunctional 3'-5' exonuclease/DNA polymerase [Actinotalea sp.]|uniref:bifunctional 3'-5' exonuclease/DNA polymerase n=1 Tax=Actinotalea sp. TaxID=1872145 RepID=UPI0035647101
MASIVVHRSGPGVVGLTEVDDGGSPTATTEVAVADLPAAVAGREPAQPRWVWDDTAGWYPPLLAAGVRVRRCHDLRLCHRILRGSALAAGSTLAMAPLGPWDERAAEEGTSTAGAPSLFDAFEEDDLVAGPRPDGGGGGYRHDDVAEHARQLAAVAGSDAPGRLRLLLAAESTGALIAAEMHHDGMPWDVAVHDEVLTSLLGPRPPAGGRPERMEALAAEVRAALDHPGLRLDSPPDLLRALQQAGLPVTSTSKHELRGIEHPVVAPLLAYKKLSRLLSANGWAWLERWVHDGRFRPDYVVGGVVTGRWATSGGGALQLPAQIRSAVRADPGWALVVADAAQLEPRVLAAMSADSAMAAAGRHADLYQGLVDSGTVETREQAKYAMLGAIYGATTGVSAALMPRLTTAFPRAIALVEEAARAGERGDVVSTWLGRSSPRPSAAWQAAREAAASEGADAADVRAARQRARDWGRFARNFVVQGTAAEWALCWMASLRRRLSEIDGRPHLVFFLHDEVMVHSPVEVAEEVAQAVRDSAAEAGRLLFGGFPVEFALQVAVVQGYDEAK